MQRRTTTTRTRRRGPRGGRTCRPSTVRELYVGDPLGACSGSAGSASRRRRPAASEQEQHERRAHRAQGPPGERRRGAGVMRRRTGAGGDMGTARCYRGGPVRGPGVNRRSGASRPRELPGRDQDAHDAPGSTPETRGDRRVVAPDPGRERREPLRARARSGGTGRRARASSTTSRKAPRAALCCDAMNRIAAEHRPDARASTRPRTPSPAGRRPGDPGRTLLQERPPLGVQRDRAAPERVADHQQAERDHDDARRRSAPAGP